MTDLTKFEDLKAGDIIETTHVYFGESVIVRLNKGPLFSTFNKEIVFYGEHLGDIGEMIISKKNFRRRLGKEEVFRLLMES